ncbi:MAG: spore coat protein [Clostridia bacterium]|nr:spore coat protein [Clostridia bacterium]
MEFNQSQRMNDQEKMTDLLTTQKFLTSMYNSYCCEAATPSVRSSLSSLLQDTHRMQEQTFNEMSTRGWYQTEKAEETKVNAAKQKFGSTVSV